MSKQKYYNGSKLRETGAEYVMPLGERSNGKSYDFKSEYIRQAYNDPETHKFIHLRRWDVDIKNRLTELYYADTPVSAITNGEYQGIIEYQKNIYLCTYDENGKPVKGLLIAYVRALSLDEHYKSGSYSDVSNILFEEFISMRGYLPNETTRLQHFVSTIFRRRKGQVAMIGNTISRMCPYFSEWQLTNIPKMKPGDIDIYEYATDQIDEEGKPVTIKIAVEFCENSGKNSKMFFGEAGKAITGSVWQTEPKPRLEKKLTEYTECYIMVVENKGFKFLCRLLIDEEVNDIFWYVEPKTTEIQKNSRVISDKPSINPLCSNGFYPLSANEAKAFSLLKQGKIFYSDNLTGTEFEQSLRDIISLK